MTKRVKVYLANEGFDMICQGCAIKLEECPLSCPCDRCDNIHDTDNGSVVEISDDRMCDYCDELFEPAKEACCHFWAYDTFSNPAEDGEVDGPMTCTKCGEEKG